VQVLTFENGAWRKRGDLAPEAARDLAWGPTLVWIRLEALAAGKLETLASVFNLHPLAIEDVRSHRQRPKVEDYPNQTFVVARAPRWNHEKDELSWLTVGIFLGPDFLITACTDHVAELDAVEKRLLAARANAKASSIDHVLYQALDTLVDSYFPLMDSLEDRIERLEDKVLARASQEDLTTIQEVKHIVSQNRKTIFPMREAMVSLEKGDYPNIRDETRLYLRDVADHMTRLAERLEHVSELSIVTHETWNASLSNQTNKVIKRLTGITFIFLVPTLVTNILSMNFHNQFPFEWPFWGVVGIIAAFTVASYWWVRRLDWI
jgi:magnesium transporter